MNHQRITSLLTKHEKKINNFFNGNISLISNEEAINKSLTIIDVRTKKEFQKGRVPNALNFPIFDDLERAEIGKIYKNLGKENAIHKGIDYFQPKINKFLLSLSEFRSKHLVVYCARGGMRSAAIARFLLENGFSVSQMIGGYKEFRSYVLKQLQKSIPPLIVLHGKTGVGKTLILKRLTNYIDLEALAEHRSSLFGGINKIPNNQKNFEALLAQKLNEFTNKFPVFIEGESRKVGKVFIPQDLANEMKRGVFVLLSASIDTRVNRIVKEYKIQDIETISKIDEILGSFIISLGKSKVQKMRWWLKKGEVENIVRMLLVDYYDPRYNNSMKKYKFAMKISTDNLIQAVDDLIDFRNELFQKL